MEDNALMVGGVSSDRESPLDRVEFLLFLKKKKKKEKKDSIDYRNIFPIDSPFI